jgi:hypothetical protein
MKHKMQRNRCKIAMRKGRKDGGKKKREERRKKTKIGNCFQKLKKNEKSMKLMIIFSFFEIKELN